MVGAGQPCTHFDAVRLTAGLVQAAADTEDPRGIDAYLAETLLGGPVFADTRWGLYYALVPAGTAALPVWDHSGESAACLGANTDLGVPDLTRTDPGLYFSYWCSPLNDPDDLCGPEAVTRLLRHGRHGLAVAEAETSE